MEDPAISDCSQDSKDPCDGFVPTVSLPLRISWEDCLDSGWFVFCHEEKHEQDYENLREFDCDDPAVVSVWIGTFPSQTTFDMYIGVENWIWDHGDDEACELLSPFWSDLAIWWVSLGSISDRDGHHWNQYYEDQRQIEQLLVNAPYSHVFKDEFIDRCRTSGLSLGNVAICLYGLDYDRRNPLFAFGHLHFVGSFRVPELLVRRGMS